ncbi:MAG: Nicotinate-nucleotide diphosphorylase (Carboxylating) [Candidatus Acidoferrum typicum]|nr:Nicotinate-nucleotide diphosphorylase (Carboxylating) [Candidatus Acidoferrum typicum]
MNWHSDEIEGLVRQALAEDVGTGDATTTAIVPQGTPAKAVILARQTLVCAGLPVVENVFRALDREMRIGCLHNDGSFVEPGTELIELAGEAQAILTAERTALNFLAHLCGIATLTRRFAEQLAGTHTRIRDTRKTTPGLRVLEKYAVKTGGGSNHRFGLYDAILIKENHIAIAGGVKAALDRAHAYTSLKMPAPRAASAYDAAGLDPEVVGPGPLSVQIEVRNEAELRDALEAGAESVLLDNMTPEAAKRCVQLARSLRRDCVIEISGGVTLENVRAYAETGADFLSSGALTHSAPAANLSLLVERVA